MHALGIQRSLELCNNKYQPQQSTTSRIYYTRTDLRFPLLLLHPTTVIRIRPGEDEKTKTRGLGVS